MSLDTKQAQQFFNQMLAGYDSKIKASQANPIEEIRNYIIDLSVARSKDNPLKVAFPFKSIMVEQASDLQTFINMIPENDSQGRGSIKLGLLDSFKTEFGMSCCYLFWDAQPRKSMKLNFFTTSEISNGRLVIDSQSVVNNVKAGVHTLQNDSLTVILGMSGGTSPTGRLSISYHSSDQNINSITDGYLVPVGYEAQVEGANFSIIQKPNTVTAIGVFHTNQAKGVFSNGQPHGQIQPTLYPDMAQAINSGFNMECVCFPLQVGITNPKKIRYQEGERISFVAQSGGTGTAQLVGLAVIKLYPKVQ